VKAVFSIFGWFLCAILFSHDRLYESLKNRDIPPFEEMTAVEQVGGKATADGQAANRSEGVFFVTDFVKKFRDGAAAPAGAVSQTNVSKNEPSKNEKAPDPRLP
jgi:hypothetical protein